MPENLLFALDFLQGSRYNKCSFKRRKEDIMEIQGLGLSSTVLSNANTSSAVGMAMLNKALDADQDTGEALTRMLERSVNPLVGQNIDIRI